MQLQFLVLFIMLCGNIKYISGDCISDCRYYDGIKRQFYYPEVTGMICFEEWSSRYKIGCHQMRPTISTDKSEIQMENIYDYKTFSDEVCNGKCGKFGYKVDWCFRDNFSWHYCDAENPKFSNFWINFSKEVDKINRTLDSGVLVSFKNISDSLRKEVKYVKTEDFDVTFETPVRTVSYAFTPGNGNSPPQKLLLYAELEVHNVLLHKTAICDKVSNTFLAAQKAAEGKMTRMTTASFKNWLKSLAINVQNSSDQVHWNEIFKIDNIFAVVCGENVELIKWKMLFKYSFLPKHHLPEYIKFEIEYIHKEESGFGRPTPVENNHQYRIFLTYI